MYFSKYFYTKMVRKCCVPKCGSKNDTPVHRLPRDTQKAEQWLRTIGRTDLIGNMEIIIFILIWK